MAKRKTDEDEADDDESSPYPDAREYALAILECLTADEWIRLHELAARYTAGTLSYQGWRSAAAHAVQEAARLMYEGLYG